MTDRQIDYLEMKRPARYQAEDGWIVQTRQPVVLNFAPSAPGNRYWYGCLLGALGHDYVKEGCILLDYGCGNAPLAVFLSGKLERFEYFGLEPAGSPTFNMQHAVRAFTSGMSAQPSSKRRSAVPDAPYWEAYSRIWSGKTAAPYWTRCGQLRNEEQSFFRALSPTPKLISATIITRTRQCLPITMRSSQKA